MYSYLWYVCVCVCGCDEGRVGTVSGDGVLCCASVLSRMGFDSDTTPESCALSDDVSFFGYRVGFCAACLSDGRAFVTGSLRCVFRCAMTRMPSLLGAPPVGGFNVS